MSIAPPIKYLPVLAALLVIFPIQIQPAHAIPQISTNQQTDAVSKSYEQLVGEGAQLEKAGNLEKALIVARQAVILNSSRYEAYALAAGIRLKQGAASPDVVGLLDRALALAPSDKQATLNTLRSRLLALPPASPKPTAGKGLVGGEINLSGQAARQQFAILNQLLVNADKSSTVQERQKLLKDYLNLSDVFVAENPKVVVVWLFRAAIGLELANPRTGWEAGNSLIALGATNTPDTRKVLSMLKSKGWLGNQAPPDSPNAFWYDYPYETEGGRRRNWTRSQLTNWVENIPGVKTIQFQVLETAKVEGNWGTIARRLPDKGVDMFIPDVHAIGRDPQWIRFRSVPNGVWQKLAEMHVQAPKSQDH